MNPSHASVQRPWACMPVNLHRQSYGVRAYMPSWSGKSARAASPKWVQAQVLGRLQAVVFAVKFLYLRWKRHLSLRLPTWQSRVERYVRRHLDKNGAPDFNINVLPPSLPKRRLGSEQTASERLWRKTVYWARSHDRAKFGTTDRFSILETQEREKIAVLGGGAFGTALATHMARKGHEVNMVIRDKFVCEFMNTTRVNPKYLSDYDLPEKLRVTTDPAEALNGASALIHAVPVQASRKVLSGIREHIPEGMLIIAASKGLELQSCKLMCDLIPEALGRNPAHNPVVAVSGPSFAKEIMDQRPTAVVAASSSTAATEQAQRLLTANYFRVSTSQDIIGVEVAGALKNVLAIAAGICEGLGLGVNAMSALVTQGTAEIRWLAIAMGAKPETLAGLSGMGDIVLTCFGSLSRNRSVGVRLGKGESITDILDSSAGIAEGVYTAEMVVELAIKYKVLLPVLTSVARIVKGEVSPRQAVLEVMSLPPFLDSA
mmetsp:Transcript_20065/g.36266  ORF Transcript_20065/g.36266 Transcript_20065/m.36266 type:complete len:488 (-) Transcript_20065:84-1547(-)